MVHPPARRIPTMDWGLIAALSLAAPILVMTPLLSGKLPGTHDAYLHLLRLINATLNIRNGSLLPRWGPQLHLGFGYPLGEFYAPGWHIVGGLFAAIGADPVTVELLAQAIGVLLYPVGGYLLARQFTNRTGALLGAAIALYAPLRFYEVFAQGNISQLIGMGLIPWVLWAFARCARVLRPGAIAAAGVLLAALTFAHHPTAALMLPFSGGYAIFAAIVAHIASPERRRAIPRALAATLAAYALALLLAAAYWVPALGEVHFVAVQSAADQFQVQNNFVGLRDLLGPIQGPDRGALNIPFPLSAGQGALILAAIGVLVAVIPRSRVPGWARVHAIGGALIAAGCIWAASPGSLPLWRLLPGAELILFPWRLLGLATPALIPAGVLALDALRLLPARWQRAARPVAAGGLTLGLFAACVPLIFPIYPDIAVRRPITPATSIQFELESGNLGGVSNDEYLPRSATQRPDYDPCPACYTTWDWQVRVDSAALPAGVTAEPLEAPAERVSAFRITAQRAARITLHQLYFPGWEAAIDGQPTPIAISAPNGLIAIDMPAGDHQLTVWNGGTALQHAADALSVLGLLILAGLLIGPRLRRRYTHASRAPEQPPISPEDGLFRPLGHVITACMLCAALVLSSPIGFGTLGPRAAGTPDTPPGMAQPIGATFTSPEGRPVLTLLGYTLPEQNTSRGGQLPLTLYWRALAPIAAKWTVKVALADPASQAAWATSESAAPGGFSTMQWDPAKYVVDTRALGIPEDAPPYVADLIVQIYAPDLGRLQVNGADRLRIGAVRITGNGDATIPADLTPINATFSDSIRLRAVRITRALNNAGIESTRLTLYWEVLRAPGVDLALMIHFREGAAETGNADQPPIPAYPTQAWQTGQYLISTMDLAPPNGTDALFIGLYERDDGARLPITLQGGASAGDKGITAQDNGLLLPLPAS